MNTEESQNGRIDWHTAFYGAIQAEFAEYASVLRFEREFHLNTEPLRLDVLIIKLKNKRRAIIRKNIGEIFRGHNILEFKSPDDNISVLDYYKAHAYVCIYMYLKKAAINDVSLTLVETKRPRTLLKHLNAARNLTVIEKYPGIYIVEGEAFPIQIIESKILSDEENIWLKNLGKNINAGKFEEIIKLWNEKYRGMNLDAYIFALMAANPEIVKIMEAKNMGATLAQVVEELGWTKEWEKRGKLHGEIQKAEETARKMLKKGYSADEIFELTGVSYERLREFD